MSYTIHDAAEYLAGGDGEMDDLHDDCPSIGIAGPFDDGSLEFTAHSGGEVIGQYRITLQAI